MHVNQRVFLTADANAEVAPVHPKAMPVILTQPDQVDAWLTAPVANALHMQRPLPDETLKVVTRRKDGVPAEMATAEPRLL